MDWIKYIRTTLGLSQEQMASYLLITRTMFAYYETGRRSPPLEIIKRLMILQEFIKDYNYSSTESSVLFYRPEIDDKHFKALQNRQQGCKMKADRFQKKLNDMRAIYKGCLKSLDILSPLSVHMNDNPDKKRIELWISICTDEIKIRMKSSGLPEQQKLRLRIAVLRAELIEIRKILTEAGCG